MILTFQNWVITKPPGSLGYQYDNDSQVLTLGGTLPEGYTWDALVQSGQNFDVWNLEPSENGPTITLSEDNLANTGEYYVQIRGTNGEVVQHTNIVSLYVPRSLVGPGTWPTLPTEFAQAEQNIKELNAHPPIPGENGYWLLWDLAESAYRESQLPVPVGPAGPANTLTIGTVETLAPGQPATAQITGEAPNQTLSLGIPQGQTGQTGATPALSMGQVETLEPGEPATAELTGTPEAPVLSLGIPEGQPGKDGPANTLQIGTVGTLAPGQPATAQITGEAPNQTLSLGIPQGQTGQTGATPALSMGQVETLEPGEPATAELTGTPEAPVLSLGIPQGQPGKDGVQLEDSAVTTTAAWSSKKIVDTLCPAFTVSGNPVVCNPVENYPFDVSLSFTPKQEGTGEPSPENVRPISGYDGVTVTQSKDEAQVKQITLTLPETIYGGTVDAVTGVGSKTWEFMEFDGTEEWGLYRNPNDTVKTFYLSIEIEIYTNYINALCDRARFISSTWAKKEPWTISSNSTTSVIYITVQNDVANTVEEWKSYLATQASAGTPVQLAYKLATPESFQATGNQALPAVAGLNTLYTDGDSLEVTGRQDLLYTLQTMQAQTQNLNRFIAEGGTQ